MHCPPHQHNFRLSQRKQWLEETGEKLTALWTESNWIRLLHRHPIIANISHVSKYWQISIYHDMYRGEQWSLFRSDEMVIFFLLEPLASMVFQWFLGYWTINTNWFSAPRPLLSRVFDGFGVIQPLVSMVFDGHKPLDQRCDGFNGSFTSNQVSIVVRKSLATDSFVLSRLWWWRHLFNI